MKGKNVLYIQQTFLMYEMKNAVYDLFVAEFSYLIADWIFTFSLKVSQLGLDWSEFASDFHA